jgi:predicted DCC family thiol-disulfide oxidoreductase YuxK
MGTDREVGIVFFDGECNLCNASVNFIIQRDRRNYFCFSSLQSDFASQAIGKIIVDKGLSTIILKKGNTLYVKSDAALEISRKLSGLWPAFYFFKIVPKFIRDFIYDFVAARRYRWFGKTSCLIPTPEWRARFLE